MNWKQLVDRCGLFVNANSRLLLNLLYEAEEELTKECLLYEDEHRRLSFHIHYTKNSR